ncbi:hypothetical protein [Evansella clarkii]|uniref:hypothetical protein n=1 Tax=Evansella clarkii TaxID=79879 RepID=UPI001432079D|nr:hypothetical protein [Evansella clarkii]
MNFIYWLNKKDEHYFSMAAYGGGNCLFLCQLSSVEYPSRQLEAFAVKKMLVLAGKA